jgi:hypothetical protein
VDDLIALQYAFWQREEDLIKVKDLIYEKMDLPRIHAQEYNLLMQSIQEELDRNINNNQDFNDFDLHALYDQAIFNVMKLLEKMTEDYPNPSAYEDIAKSFHHVNAAYARLIQEQQALM